MQPCRKDTKNLNAQINSYTNVCTNEDRDAKIEGKLAEMFGPKDKRCYQKLAVLPALDQLALERDKTTLVILKPAIDFPTYFAGQKYKNRVAFLTAVDPAGIFNVNKKAQRLWAISQVAKDMTPEDSQYKKAKETEAEYQTELFLAIKAVVNKFYYPLVDDEGETALVPTTLLDSYIDPKTGHQVKYRNEEASKGEFVVEATLREANKFQVFNPGSGDDKLKVYQPLRNRIEAFLFPPTGRTTWDQIKDGAASRGHILWTEPGTVERMREALITAGAWREDAGQIQKPPFDEITSVTIEYARDKDSGVIATTDIKLAHADKLFVREDAGEWQSHPTDQPLVSESMLIEFKAVDGSGKNKEGKPYRIENTIDLIHDFVPSPNPGHQVIKVKVVPPTSKLVFTLDGTNPANQGLPYAKPGIEAPDGATVRLFAEKGGVTREVTIAVPKPKGGGDGGGDGGGIDPVLPATVSGKAFTQLVTRSATYHFLTNLPADARLQMVQAKVTVAATDNTVTLTWDRKTRLEPASVMTAFEFLDQQVTGGEWSLRFDQLHFATGTALLQWQVDTSSKIALTQVTQ